MPPNLHRLVLFSTHHCVVALKERLAKDTEVSQPLSPHGLGLVFRLLGPRQPKGFWEKAADAIEAGNSIIEIVPVAGGAPTVSDV